MSSCTSNILISIVSCETKDGEPAWIQVFFRSTLHQILRTILLAWENNILEANFQRRVLTYCAYGFVCHDQVNKLNSSNSISVQISVTGHRRPSPSILSGISSDPIDLFHLKVTVKRRLLILEDLKH